MKPQQHLLDLWLTVADLMPFHSDGIKQLVPCDVDPMPGAGEEEASIGQQQGQGRRSKTQLDGWGITWQGRVQPAWIVDVCTSAAIMVHSTETFWGPPMPAGVSLAINMTYFHPAKVGTDILVKVRILKCSLTSANLQCDIVDKTTGKLYASGTHIKAWRAPKAPVEPRAKL